MHGVVRPLLKQNTPIPSGAQFAVDDQEFRIQPMGEFNERIDDGNTSFEEWLLTLATTTAIPYWAIALILLIAVVIFAIFNVQAGQPSSNTSNIQKRFGLITPKRSGRAAHMTWAVFGEILCALAMLGHRLTIIFS